MNINLHANSNPTNQISENLNDVNKAFLSFVAKISSVDFTLLLDEFINKSDFIYYFSQPEKNISFLSFEQLTKQTFNNFDFNLISKEIEILKSKMISNHDKFKEIIFPLFLTNAKFPSTKVSEEWKDFGEIDLIIPKLSLYQICGSYFLIHNVFTENFSHDENLYEVLDQHVNKIFEIESNLKQNTSAKSIINQLEQSDDEIKWSKKIVESTKKIKQKSFEKVVLARRIMFDIKSKINWQDTLQELDNKYPLCTNFVIKSEQSIFFGSTPELLARFSGNNFYTEALAGSINRGSNLEEDTKLENDLLKSSKNIFEHDFVTDHIKNSLANYTSKIVIDEKPVVKKLSNIQHLQTGIKGTLKTNANMFDVVSSLFPTPAVCGIPKDLSLQIIEQNEEFDRGLFAGLLGWFDENGFGEFNVAIRSALIKGNNLYIYAGCGIVEGSDPAEEFEETQLKLKPILSLFDLTDAN
jgi:menaquinone-specific isochorismate synthase